MSFAIYVSPLAQISVSLNKSHLDFERSQKLNKHMLTNIMSDY